MGRAPRALSCRYEHLLSAVPHVPARLSRDSLRSCRAYVKRRSQLLRPSRLALALKAKFVDDRPRAPREAASCDYRRAAGYACNEQHL